MYVINFGEFSTISTSNISSLLLLMFLLFLLSYVILFVNCPIVLGYSVPFFQFFSPYISVWEAPIATYFKLMDSFLIHVQATNEPTKDCSVAVFFISGIPFDFFLEFPSLCYSICYCTFFFFIRALKISITVILNSLSDNPQICVIPESGSDA